MRYPCCQPPPSAVNRSTNACRCEIFHLHQSVLRAEQRVFRVEHGQDVHRARRHLHLREFEGAPRLGDRILLPLLLLGGLLRRDQRALDIAEGGEHRLVVGRQQFGIARLAEGELAAQRAAVKDRLGQARGERVDAVRRD